MITVRKKAGVHVIAYRLGESDPVLEQLMREGRLIRREGGYYEVFTRETAGEMGELAKEGDYLKIDSSGYPYPNEKSFFEKNHRKLADARNEYEQICEPLPAWLADEPVSPEVRFLLREKQLTLDPERPQAFFTAPLWGTVESAARDAVLVFYSIDRNADGEITDADFNFVCRDEFDKTYDIISQSEDAADGIPVG